MFQTHSYFCLLKQNACQPVAFKKNFRLANACNWIQRVRSIICSGYNLAVLAEGWTQQMDGCWLLAPSHRLCVWKQPNTPHLRVQRRAALSLSGPSPESTLRCEGQARNRLSKIIKKKKKKVHGLIQGRCSCQGEKITLMHLLRLSLIVLMAIILSLIFFPPLIPRRRYCFSWSCLR